ncbi:DNA repair protein SbcC/Rad50 [Frankia sp. AiPs1]|uniref:AAA family ATPase n=1 Tax=Frankia sp. AiPa1 TaxID=573492 RepID=UPI00202B208A|nr:AAA family ATPase [Frankia sp. AiPa1]MCL9761792.1 AAA family ATPase [Frankia sp. AiPa1]
MRPHRLSLEAFGAFPGRVDLDLDEVGGGGLLLLCGETGGGKTTLLDAIGFALFGEVPGLRGKLAGGPDLRSHHAPAAARPWVSLEFTVAGDRYRTTRSPAWDRPRRASGTTRAHPTATLEHRLATTGAPRRSATAGAHARGLPADSISAGDASATSASATSVSADGWETIASRPQDVGHEIGLLLGMTADQFFQVVMLPQGRFADFLQADHDDREKLLKRLFRVSRFEFTEQWLHDRAKTRRTDLDEARTALGRVAARIAQAAGVIEPESLPDEPSWSAVLTDTAAETATAATADLHLARQALDAAETSLAATRDLADRIRRRRELDLRHDELTGDQDRIEALAATADAARRATVVAPALTELRQLTAAAAQTRTAADDAHRSLARYPADLLTATGRTPAPDGGSVAGNDVSAGGGAVEANDAYMADKDLAADDALVIDRLTATVRVAHVEIGRLTGLAHTLAAAHRDTRDAVEADAQAAAHRDEAVGLEVRLCDELPTRLADADARVGAARDASAALPGLTERARWARELTVAVDQHRTAVATARDARAAADHTRTHADDLRRERVDAMTAELAAALVDDTPCPVCGALEHPDPAEVRARPISKKEETDAARKADRAAIVAADAFGTVRALDERIRTLHAELTRAPSQLPPADPLRAEVGQAPAVASAAAETALIPPVELLVGDVSEATGATGTGHAAVPADATGDSDATGTATAQDAAVEVALPTIADRLDLAVDEHRHASDDLPAAQEAQRQAQTALTDATARLAALREAGSSAGLRADQARDRAARGLAEIPDSLRTDGALTRRLETVRALADDAETARYAEQTAEQARAAHVRAGLTTLELVRQAGFTDLDDAVAALRDDPWLRATETEVRDHRDELAGIARALASPDLAVDPEANLPLAEHEAAAAQARTSHEAAVGAQAQAAQRAAELAELHIVYTGGLTALRPLRTEVDELHHLAEVTAGRGGNTEGMPLSSFVLAARLEEVAAAASRRLAAMSSGRFTLVHDTEGRRDRRRRAGLGLLVDDAWTGRPRHTRTLSGGETFQAALSLALGLADVVTAEAGGRRLDALFIDEGFGTLDANSLDEVMAVLDELRSGGRLVGLVSHVAELRTRIPNQVRVIKETSGSRVETTP